jgi:rubrerythrin
MDDASPTRRQLLSLALSGGVAACAGTALGAVPTPGLALGAEPVSDPKLVQLLLGAELLAAAVYERVLATGLLSPRAQRATRELLAHEHAHAAALQAELTRLATAAPPAPADIKAVQSALSDHQVTRSLTDLHHERDCLDLLLDLENLMEGAYYQAMSKLARPRLQQLGAQILASEAQHYARLGELRRHKDFSRAVPYAFVEGRY